MKISWALRLIWNLKSSFGKCPYSSMGIVVSLCLLLLLTVSTLLAQQSEEREHRAKGYPLEQIRQALRERPEKSREEPDVASQERRLLDKSTPAFYGYDFFVPGGGEATAPALSFMPLDYRLGPGDRIGIYLTGKIEKALDAVVTVEGKIYVPPAGVFSIQGFTLAEFKDKLTDELSRFYDNFSVDLMLVSPKTVQVAVVGEVNRPGKYVLSALNTIFDALVAARGPKVGGSLRNIELYRNGELFRSVDLYEFFMKKASSRDILLDAGDRIFVPLVESTIVVLGEVKRPGIYELRADSAQTLTDAIALAGGLTDYALHEKIEISRLEDSGYRSTSYIDLSDTSSSSSASTCLLENNDRVRVFSKLDRLHERVVSIHGAVRNPGEYVLEDNLHLSDLILKAGHLNRSAYLLEAEVAKVDPKTPARSLTIDLHRLLNEGESDQDILLEEDDQVFIREIPNWQVGPMVQVRGEVMFPGFYSIVKDSTLLSEIMKKCGGFTDEALIRETRLIRKSSKILLDKEYERLKTMTRDQMSDLEYEYLVMKESSQDLGRIVVDFHKLVVEHDLREDVILEDGDLIEAPKAPVVVGVTGRVARPGGVLHNPGARLDYYIRNAGGYAWDANSRKTKVIKVTGEILDDEDAKELVPGDIIYVPRKRDRDYWLLFRQIMLVTAQIATVVLVLQNALRD